MGKCAKVIFISNIFHPIFKIKENRSGGAVDTKVLAAAWQKVVDRHPILRTIFVESNYKNGTFDQIVLKKADATPTTIACNDERTAPKKPKVPNAEVVAIRVGDLQEKEALLATGEAKFFTEPHYNGFAAILVRLPLIDPAELEELIVDGWRCLAPRTLVAAWERGEA